VGSIFKRGTTVANGAEAWTVLEEYTRGDDEIFSVIESVKMDGDTRVISTKDGQTLYEQVVSADPENRRVSYTIPGFGGAEHHHASIQIIENSGATEVVWITDVVPESVLEGVRPVYDQAFTELVEALDRAASS
jgi:hypothetical protein